MQWGRAHERQLKKNERNKRGIGEEIRWRDMERERERSWKRDWKRETGSERERERVREREIWPLRARVKMLSDLSRR